MHEGLNVLKALLDELRLTTKSTPRFVPAARVCEKLTAYAFFFQAEDGIRDDLVTWSSDVCSSDLLERRVLLFAPLPPVLRPVRLAVSRPRGHAADPERRRRGPDRHAIHFRLARSRHGGGLREIGRASCRERV